MNQTTTTLPRMPYGMAKRIVAAMRVGDVVTVRPAWVVPMHNAARRLGLRLAAVSFTRESDGEPMARMLRVEAGWRTGHAVSRRPQQDPRTGRWRAAA